MYTLRHNSGRSPTTTSRSMSQIARSLTARSVSTNGEWLLTRFVIRCDQRFPRCSRHGRAGTARYGSGRLDGQLLGKLWRSNERLGGRDANLRRRSRPTSSPRRTAPHRRAHSGPRCAAPSPSFMNRMPPSRRSRRTVSIDTPDGLPQRVPRPPRNSSKSPQNPHRPPSSASIAAFG